MSMVDDTTCPECGGEFTVDEQRLSKDGHTRLAVLVCEADPSHRFEHVTLFRAAA